MNLRIKFLSGWKLIDVSLEDAHTKMATNGLVIDRKTIMIASGLDDLAKALRAVGQTVIETFTIGNTGGSDLSWAIEAGFRADAPLRTASSPPASDGIKGRPIAKADGDAVINVLWYGDHGLGGIALWSIIIDDITGRGAVVTETSGPMTTFCPRLQRVPTRQPDMR